MNMFTSVCYLFVFGNDMVWVNAIHVYCFSRECVQLTSDSESLVVMCAVRHGLRFLACIMIQLTPECDLGM